MVASWFRTARCPSRASGTREGTTFRQGDLDPDAANRITPCRSGFFAFVATEPAYLAAQGLAATQGLLAAQGLVAAQGFAAAQGLAAQGFQAEHGLTPPQGDETAAGWQGLSPAAAGLAATVAALTARTAPSAARELLKNARRVAGIGLTSLQEVLNTQAANVEHTDVSRDPRCEMPITYEFDSEKL